MSDAPIKSNGPALQTYVETRFNLLIESVNDKLAVSNQTFRAFIDSTNASVISQDLRYQQRFEAQSAAITTAFLSQQTAMTTAFTASEKAVGSALEAAKEAVQAALAAADRAVTKTEVSSDKRFESLGELIVQRFDGVTEKIEAISRRVELLESRTNVMAGESSGGQRGKDDNKAMWAVVISIIGMVIGITIGVLGLVLRK